MNFHSTTNSYTEDRYSLILQVEENGAFHLTPYNDGKGWVTIGVGFNLADSTVRSQVFAKLGIVNTSLINKLTEYLTTQHLTSTDSDIQIELDSIMSQYTPGATFKFTDENQIKALFNGPNGNDGLVKTYEKRVDDWAKKYGLAAIPESKERLVLLSLAYNGVLGGKLALAMNADNRAEAWYEIRYGSNGDGLPGLAKRHYYEAEVFGLYNDPTDVTESEAKQVLQMYTRHHQTITAYEALYGVGIDGRVEYRNTIDEANNDYSLSGTSQVDTLAEALTLARDILIDRYVSQKNINVTINGEVLVGDYALNLYDHLLGRDETRPPTPQAPQASNDLLIGGIGSDELKGLDGDDVLYGEDGNDYLEGGKGNDILIGGKGLDTYIWNTGDGTDTIIDEDKQGFIIINNGTPQNLFAVGAFVETALGSGTWTQTLADGSVLTLTHHSPWRLVTADGSEIILGNDWQDGDFGIHLQNLSTSEDIGQTIIGDLASIDFDPDVAGIQTQTDELGNIKTDADQPEANREDILYDSTGNDRLQGLGGQDLLDALRGGDDILEGGADSDALLGGEGDDRLYGNREQSFADLVAAGTATGQRGDLLAGNLGSDQLYGSNGNDAMAGGDGADTLVGGLGDDVLLGDDNFTSATTNWSVTQQYLSNGQGGLTHKFTVAGAGYQPSIQGGNDLIYGGAGEDLVFAGFGNDTVDAGSDNDVVFGGAGHDVIQGQGGNDILVGDNYGDVPFGNDYISGGSGNDWLYGTGGDDYLDGGDGNDILLGDHNGGPINTDGVDVLNGGLGNDIVYGGGKDDLLSGAAGNDALYGEDDNDTLDGGEGNDYLDGNEGNDILLGGTGIDLLFGGNGNDYLDGGDGDDLSSANGNAAGEGGLSGEAGDDAIYGGAGNDELAGGEGLDFLDGGTGDDLLFGESGDDTLFGGEGHDQLQGGDGNDNLDAGAGNDFLFGEAGDDYLYGNDGDDELQGEEGNDILSGGAGVDKLFGQNGDDTLEGGDGADILVGGSGNDTIQGGAGRDIYVYNLNDGIDIINDFAEIGANGVRMGNILHFGTGIGQNDLSLSLGSLLINLTNGGAVHIEGFDPDNPLVNPVIDTFTFANGTTLSYNQLISRGFDIAGTAQDDVLQGTATNDRIFGLEGSDTIFAGAGNDSLDGGAGNDLLDGGQGTDVLTGGLGDDSYLFGAGFGQDTVIDADGAADAVQIEGSLTQADITLFRTGNDVIIGLTQGDDRLVLKDWYLTGNRVEYIRFADGSLLDAGAIEQLIAGSILDAQDDIGFALEDAALVTNGNLLTNDGTSTVLAVTNPGQYSGIYGELSLTVDGNYTYVLNNEAALVQSLILGQSVEDSFEYTATDTDSANLRQGGAMLRIIIAGANDVPIIVADSAIVDEDGATTAQGNVLANDHDVDAGTMLSVSNPGSMTGTYGTFTIDAAGSYTYMLNNGAAGVQSLRGDETVTENFTYIASDGMTEIAGLVTIDVTGRDDAPLALNDPITVTEDDATLTTGNVLDNDSDPDRGTSLRVSNAGSFAGSYGSLNLAADGRYIYQLNSTSSSVQALSSGQTVMETFNYTMLDNDALSPLSGSATLEVAILGTNDAPTLVQPIADQNGTENQIFLFALPTTTFVDIDQGDVHTLSATLADGGALPGWLSFDAAAGVFQGSPVIGNVGAFDVKVTATDASELSASDTFTMTIAAAAGQGLNLKGTNGFDTLTGSGYDDRIEGMRGWDLLFGKGGNDTLFGGAGNDRLEGGTGADRLFGESGIDWLLGNDGNDLLDGGSNPDVMIGGDGNDNYVVDNLFDVVRENSNEGVDTVDSAVSHILAINLENLTLTGSTAINGTGNTLNNVLTGNSAANSLSGGAGNDTLNGLAGTDTLTGGSGNDTYQFGRGYGTDTVVENNATAGNTDVARFLADIAADQLWFQHVANNLEVSIIGTTDKLVVKDWYSGSANHIERFQTTGGQTLLDSQVDNLVSAMAAFVPPAAGQTTLPADYQTTLNPVLAANWQ